MASIKFLKEQSPEVSILKKIQYPKNYIFAVYLHDQTGAQLALISNKRDKPLRVLPLKKGENFLQGKFCQNSSECCKISPEF